MPARYRLIVYLVIGGLWLTGCAWLLLDTVFARRGPFGKTPHPLEPPLLLLHALTAILSMYLLGWLSAGHMVRWWRRGLRRQSGAVLATLFASLAISGFSLFFLVDDAWQHAAASVHDWLGVAVTVFAIQHWFVRERYGR